MRKIFVLTIVFAGIFSVLCPSGPSAELSVFQMQNSLVGKTAPDFTLPTLKGKKVSLTQYRAGNSAIVFFWATWCPHCREQLTELSKSAASMQEKGIQVVLVDVGEAAKQVNAYVTKYEVPYEVFLDAESAVAESYSIIGVPTFLFIGKDGLVKAVKHAIPENYETILNPEAQQARVPEAESNI